jgi:ATP-dependent helicase/nuclease subunit A
LLDDNLGVCPMVRPAGTERAYPSLALWLGRRRKRRDVLGEELRLLYVAMTRARDRLILCGSARQSQIEKQWGERVRDLSTEDWIEAARSPMDWAGCWLMAELGVEELPASGSSRLLSWNIVATDQIPKPAARVVTTDAGAEASAGAVPPDFVVLRDLERRLSWAYPYAVAEETPAKTSVSAIRRQMDEEGDEARPARFLLESEEPSAESDSGGLSAAETGVAHHLFMQWARIELLANVEGCLTESRRLVDAGYLSEPQAAALKLEALAGFWASDLGMCLAANRDKIERELPFTARFDPRELVELGLMESQPALAGEFILVQGVVDLAVFLPSEIWIVDFKTDRVPPSGLEEKVARYRPQIMTYARALEKAHGRPVTQGYLHFLSCGRSERVL